MLFADYHVQLLTGPGGHQFYPKPAWPPIDRVKRGWEREL